MNNSNMNSWPFGRVIVVAEVAGAHQGSMEQAAQLVEAAARAGVDGVKFQKFTADELCVRRHSRHAHFSRLEMSSHHLKELFVQAHDLGLKFYCDAFGLESAEELLVLPVDGIKVHSSDLGNSHLLRRLNGWQGNLLLSCGGSADKEIASALNLLQDSLSNLTLLHGFQSFPTPLAETHLLRIAHLRRTFGLPVGFMDHIDAEDELAHTLPMMAMGAGAVFLEKHITLDRALKGIDYFSSFNPDELDRFVKNVRRIEDALGSEENIFGPDEKKYRNTMKKHLVAVRPLATGAVLGEEDVTWKRTEDSCFSLNSSMVLGKTLRMSLDEEETIRLDHFELRVGIMLIARMNSSRLPGKVMMEIIGRPALSHLIERAKLSFRADVIVLCTTSKSEDDVLTELAASSGISCYRGDELDVLGRVLGACEQEQLDIAVRVTGDDILLSPGHLDQAVIKLLTHNADYCHNRALPGGTECEVFTIETLRAIHDYAMIPDNTEYLTYFVENENFQKCELDIPKKYRRQINLTLDTLEDFERISFLLKNIYDSQSFYTMDDLVGFVDSHPGRFKTADRRKLYCEVRDTINCDLDFSRAVG